MKRDTLYSNPLGEVAQFTFDQQVVDVFPDMIKRSVPGYATIINMIGNLANIYVKANTQCYDLGCSLGAATLAMRHGIRHEGCKIIGVDNSQAMIQRCRQIIDIDTRDIDVVLQQDEIQNIVIKNASLVVLNFTLQFIPVDERQNLINKIASGLNPGGVLILSEKIIFEDKEHQELMTDLHHNFKRANGYSDLEIAQKRSAIENYLIPETLAIHRQRMKDAGFSSVDVWFQCFNFASMIAIK